MKAAVLVEPGRMLEVKDVDTPTPGPGEILVKVAACGVCHTDLHYIEHGVPTFMRPPLILGHEASGTVAALGNGVETPEVGTRVLLPAVVTCGRCPYCRTGKENICQKMAMFGNHVNGAYAEYFVAPAKEAFVLPDAIPLEEGSVIADAISTPFHAVKNRGQVRPGDVVVVFGCGGVGMNAVQIAAAAGAQVIAVDVAERKLAWAKEFGATCVLNAASEENVPRAIRRLAGSGGADVAFEVIGRPETIETAFECVRPGGRLVIVGYTAEKVSLSAARIMFREVEVVGSLGCRPVDYPRLIQLCAAGKVNVSKLVTHRFALEDIAEAFGVMKAGESLRSVVIP
ncbi:MAG: zinc-binding dehydrogenase [Acidobacteriota bacterium]